MPAIPPAGSALGDRLVSLRLTAERDIPEILIAYQDDRHMHERLGQARPPSGADLGRASEQAPDDRAAGVCVQLTITEPGADTCVGQVTVHEIDWDNARAELLVWVAPGARGRGYAPAALRIVAGWLFAASELARLAILVELDNTAMLKAAATAGFRDEGILRSYRATRRGRLDLAVLSLLPEDL
jgi:RimJ/RimL family protein N-acetyltransferase